jgi:hypothetical protein
MTMHTIRIHVESEHLIYFCNLPMVPRVGETIQYRIDRTIRITSVSYVLNTLKELDFVEVTGDLVIVP